MRVGNSKTRFLLYCSAIQCLIVSSCVSESLDQEIVVQITKHYDLPKLQVCRLQDQLNAYPDELKLHALSVARQVNQSGLDCSEQHELLVQLTNLLVYDNARTSLAWGLEFIRKSSTGQFIDQVLHPCSEAFMSNYHCMNAVARYRAGFISTEVMKKTEYIVDLIEAAFMLKTQTEGIPSLELGQFSLLVFDAFMYYMELHVHKGFKIADNPRCSLLREDLRSSAKLIHTAFIDLANLGSIHVNTDEFGISFQRIDWLVHAILNCFWSQDIEWYFRFQAVISTLSAQDAIEALRVIRTLSECINPVGKRA